VLAAIIWRKLDPPLPRKRYSWEDEPDDPSADEPLDGMKLEAPRVPAPAQLPDGSEE